MASAQERSALKPAEWLAVAEAPAEGRVKVPVEVVVQGSAAEWVLIEVEPQSIPEPGTAALCLLGGLWLLRRKRSGNRWGSAADKSGQGISDASPSPDR